MEPHVNHVNDVDSSNHQNNVKLLEESKVNHESPLIFTEKESPKIAALPKHVQTIENQPNPEKGQVSQNPQNKNVQNAQSKQQAQLGNSASKNIEGKKQESIPHKEVRKPPADPKVQSSQLNKGNVLAVNESNKAIAEEKAVIKRLFDDFDKDQSGSIDAKEIKKFAEELGQKMTDDDLKIIFSEADKDSDKKVSFDEFWKYWESGSNKKLGNLIKLRLQVANMIKEAGEPKIKFFIDLLNKTYDKSQHENYSIEVAAGPGPFKTVIGLEWNFGQEAVKKKLEFDSGSKLENGMGFVLKFRILKREVDKEKAHNDTQYMKEVKEKFESLVESTKEFLESIDAFLASIFKSIKFNFSVKDDFILFDISTTDISSKKYFDMIFNSKSENIGGQSHTTSNFGQIEIGLKNDFYDMNQHSYDEKLKTRKFLLEVFEGFKFSFNATLNTQMIKEIRDQIAKDYQALLQNNAIATIVMQLLMTTKLDLKLKDFDPQSILKFINNIGAGGTFKKTPTFRDMLSLAKKVGITKQLTQLGAIAHFIEFLHDYVEADVAASIVGPNLIGVLRIKTKGIKEIWDFISSP